MDRVRGSEQSIYIKHARRFILAVFVLPITFSVCANEFLSFVESDNVEKVKSAIEAGVDVNVVSSSKGTPLHIAAKNGNKSIAILLLESGADISAKMGKSQKTALHLAAQEGHYDLVSLLLDLGANIDMKDKKGETAIFSAILKNRINVVELLIENNADINVVNRFKDTPAYKSVALGKPEITEILIEHNASLDLERVVEKKCSKCHGMEGRSQAPFSPNLASMGQHYLVQQFQDYRSGARAHIKMDKRLTTGMSDIILVQLAEYYASMPAVDLKSDEDVIARGKELYEMNTGESNSCAGCHATDGISTDTALPRLAGQNAEYIAIQLRAYREDERSNDAEGVMREISKGLTDQQILDLAGYVQSL